MASDHLDIFKIYNRYCDTLSSGHANSKDLLNVLSQSLESRGQIRDEIVGDLSKLMSCLHLSVDSRQFNCFYDFVFFACREDGQKNITVSRAISAWRFVLAGRFRLLNQWCSFVEEHQKHNISQDTWQQLLAFSRCVNEDLDGYDPKGAWPVLIDDFVEHMYRVNQPNNSSPRGFCCSCEDRETPGITTTFSGLNLLPGSKRKHTIVPNGQCDAIPTIVPNGQCDAIPISYYNSANSDHWMKPKRAKPMEASQKYECLGSDLDLCTVDSLADDNRHKLLGCLQTSPSACPVKDCSSKGFEGHLSIGRHVFSSIRIAGFVARNPPRIRKA